MDNRLQLTTLGNVPHFHLLKRNAVANYFVVVPMFNATTKQLNVLYNFKYLGYMSNESLFAFTKDNRDCVFVISRLLHGDLVEVTNYNRPVFANIESAFTGLLTINNQ